MTIEQSLLKVHNSWFSRFNAWCFVKMAGIDKLPKDTSILDVGCGTGNVMMIFAKKGFYRVYGIDNSQDMVKNTRNLGLDACLRDILANFRIPKIEYKKTVKLELSGIYPLIVGYNKLLKDSTFKYDAVILLGVLHHMKDKEDWATAINNCAFLLADNSLIYIRELHPSTKFVARLFSLLRFTGIPYFREYYHCNQEEDSLHTYFLDNIDYFNELIEKHFTIIKKRNWLAHQIIVGRKK